MRGGGGCDRGAAGWEVWHGAVGALQGAQGGGGRSGGVVSRPHQSTRHEGLVRRPQSTQGATVPGTTMAWLAVLGTTDLQVPSFPTGDISQDMLGKEAVPVLFGVTDKDGLADSYRDLNLIPFEGLSPNTVTF